MLIRMYFFSKKEGATLCKGFNFSKYRYKTHGCLLRNNTGKLSFELMTASRVFHELLYGNNGALTTVL